MARRRSRSRYNSCAGRLNCERCGLPTYCCCFRWADKKKPWKNVPLILVILRPSRRLRYCPRLVSPLHAVKVPPKYLSSRTLDDVRTAWTSASRALWRRYVCEKMLYVFRTWSSSVGFFVLLTGSGNFYNDGCKVFLLVETSQGKKTNLFVPWRLRLGGEPGYTVAITSRKSQNAFDRREWAPVSHSSNRSCETWLIRRLATQPKHWLFSKPHRKHTKLFHTDRQNLARTVLISCVSKLL